MLYIDTLTDFKSTLHHDNSILNINQYWVTLTKWRISGCFTSVATPPSTYSEKFEVSQIVKE